MDLSNPGIIYILLVIPALFGVAVTGQGIVKMSRGDPGGGMALAVGAACFVLIGVTYFLFIR